MGRKKSKKRKPKKRKPKKRKPKAALKIPPPPWIELPGDVTAHILQRLGTEEILRTAQRVCSTWWKLCKDPAMWRVISLQNRERINLEYDTMCRRAVDLSQGELMDLTLDYFGDDDLITYIAQRSSNLKRLTLISCYYISGETLAQAVKEFPQLEELHFTITLIVDGGDIETIGLSCPKLKSFSYNEQGFRNHSLTDLYDHEFYDGLERNEYAIAIAKSMPNLRHLKLIANYFMQNEGLETILDGCPHLESLDIRHCFGLDLGGDLGKRCRDQIKYLKLPSDSTSDISWFADEPSAFDHYDPFDSVCDFSDYDYDYHEDYDIYDDYTSPLGLCFDRDFAPFFFVRRK